MEPNGREVASTLEERSPLLESAGFVIRGSRVRVPSGLFVLGRVRGWPLGAFKALKTTDRTVLGSTPTPSAHTSLVYKLAVYKLKIDSEKTASEWMQKMTGHKQAADEVSKLYEKLLSRRDKLREQLVEVEKEFEAVSTTLKLMGQPTPGLYNLDLSGKTHLEALIAIAKANDNILIVKTARRLMGRAGLFKTAKNASSILFTAINRDSRFSRLEPGKYQFVEQKEAPKSASIPEAVLVEPFDFTPTSFPKRA